jgi:MFS family permease
MSVNGAVTHLSAMLTDRGVTAATAALAASVLGLSSFLGRIVTGVLLDRFFGPRVGLIMQGLTALGILMLATAQTASAGLAGAALVGLGVGAEADVTPYLLSRYFGLRAFSTLYGLTWTAYAVAGAIGPILLGRAFDLTGSYTSLLTMLSGSTLLSALLLMLLPRYPTAMTSRRTNAT